MLLGVGTPLLGGLFRVKIRICVEIFLVLLCICVNVGVLLGCAVFYPAFEISSYFFLIDGLVVLIDVVGVEPAHSLLLTVVVSHRLVIAVGRYLG